MKKTMTKPSHVKFKLDQQTLVDQDHKEGVKEPIKNDIFFWMLDSEIESHSYQASGRQIATRYLYFFTCDD